MFGNQLKKIFSEDTLEKNGNDKRKIENMVFFVVLLIVTIVVINIVWKGNKKDDNNIENTYGKQLAFSEPKYESDNVNTDNLEDRLESILKKIQGVGDVKVLINYSESSEVVAMYNENSRVSDTEELDKNGDTRKIQEKDLQKEIIYQEENGEKVPITQKIIKPKVEGAIVTAKGANDVNVKANIVQAVEAVTGLATHKIQVFVMN